MSKKTVEIKLGNAVYQVEREFVGTVSREELLVSQLIEKYREVRQMKSPSKKTIISELVTIE